MLYCIFPREFEEAAYAAVVDRWRDKAGAMVVVDRRYNEPSAREPGSVERRRVVLQGAFRAGRTKARPVSRLGDSAA